MKFKTKLLIGSLAALSVAVMAHRLIEAAAALNDFSKPQHASDQGPRTLGAAVSMMGVVEQSTGTDPTTRMRKVVVDDEGRILMKFTVDRSSFVTLNFTSNTPTINGIDQSTTTHYRNSTGTIFFSSPNLPAITTRTVVQNLNVMAICSSSQPCSNLSIKLGGLTVGLNAPQSTATVRVFDSRGSTQAGSPGSIWEGYLSTNALTSISFNVPFSSGINILHDGAPIYAEWAVAFEGGDGATR